MQDAPDDAHRRLDGGVEHPLGAAPPQRPGRRTAAAGSEFLKALGSDVAAAATRLRQALTRRPASGRKRPGRPMPAGAGAPSAVASRVFAGWRIVRRLVLGILLAGIGGALVMSCAMLWALHGVPLDRPSTLPRKPALLLEAANGEPLGRVGPFRVADVPLTDYPPILIKAVLSTEDRRFYHHFGVDPLGILRAAHANRVAGAIVEGGSTITQQLVKQEYLSDDRTYSRKLREALLAIWLELRLGKNQILARYLNRVYLGDGVYGMAAAARLYFDKSPAALTLPEAAMLAGLIQAPSELDPLRHLAAARRRAATVLDAMVANGAIGPRAAAIAKANPAAVKRPPRLAQARSWFTDWVAKRAADLAGSRSGSVRVRTTLMPRVQALAQQALDEALARDGRRLGVSQGALVAMRPDGAVVAMVGGRSYRNSQFNRAVAANRQPGSAFKLFVYLAALRQGYTPQDTIDGGPIDINGWKPQNFDNEHYGRITLADAFAQSVNTASVRLAMEVGIGRVITAARDLGIDTPLPHVPSIALGSAGVSLLDLTGAFASVRADRLHVQPWGVAAVGGNNDGRLSATVPLASSRTLGADWQPLVGLLRGVVEHGTGRAAALDGFAAGKTGTSQDYRDAWFIGFNDALVVGVWVGNDDDGPMRRVVGGSLPAGIWKRFITEASPLIGPQAMPAAAASTIAEAPQPMGAVSGATLDDQAAAGSSTPPSLGMCDYQACSSAYHSFRASDCTYQPYSGSRRLCEIGEPSANPPDETATLANAPGDAPEGVSGDTPKNAPAQCNFDACARTYQSFDPADCSYEPYGGGPRRVCEK